MELPHSKMKESIAQLLKREGYVAEVAVEGKPIKKIKIKLKYNGRKPRHRRLAPRQFAGLAPLCRRARRFRACAAGWAPPSCPPPEGIMTGTQARKKNVGGELLCEVW